MLQDELVMARFFERPKCKPWDIVKGRRLPCCHGLGEHTRYCFEGLRRGDIAIPQFKEISSSELLDATNSRVDIITIVRRKGGR